MALQAYCRIPKSQKKIIRTPEGTCPELLYDLIKELEGANEINISFYLFNNPILFDFLQCQAKKGCKIKITSLPLRGYKNNFVKVKDYPEKISGQKMAGIIYEKIGHEKNIELRMFPHQYVWYGALYAGGGASYSFHVKAIYAKFDKGLNKCILSSGNFMFTDPAHSDNFIVVSGLEEYENAFKCFFSDLDKFSIPYKTFLESYLNPEDEFMYSFLGKEINLSKNKFNNCFFTSPFYRYDGEGSNHYAGNRIIELILSAKDRVWVLAQHFHDLISFDTQRTTIINAIHTKFKEKKEIDFRFLKQVPHSSLAEKRRAGIAEAIFQFEMKAKQKYNKLVHDKFMLIDNNLIISTANYTSTQFAFSERKMEFKKDGKTFCSKMDNFAEVNGFLILPNCNPNILQTYEKHFINLWDSGIDIKLNL